MLFNWDTTNLCIVFRSWHIRGTPSFLLSMFAIAILVAGYEALRAYTTSYSAKAARDLEQLPSMSNPFPPLPSVRVSRYQILRFAARDGKRNWLYQKVSTKVAQKITESVSQVTGNETIAETRPLLGVGSKRVEVGGKEHVVKALLYAAQTFYAFMIM